MSYDNSLTDALVDIVKDATDLSIPIQQLVPSGAPNSFLRTNSSNQIEWGSGSITYSRMYFVSKEGNNSNTGQSTDDPLLTISEALSRCVTEDVVRVLDNGNYIENIIVPAHVGVKMTEARLFGTIQLHSSSMVDIFVHLPSGNNQIMVQNYSITGCGYRAAVMSSLGATGIRHFQNFVMNSRIFVDTLRINVTDGNIGFYTEQTSSSINVNTDPTAFSSSDPLNSGNLENLVVGSGGFAQWNISTTASYPISITYNDGNSYIVNEYKIKAHTASRTISDWTLEGFDGVTWILLDTVSGQVWNSFGEERFYTISSPASYEQYRLIFTNANGDTRPMLNEFGLFSGSMSSIGGSITIDNQTIFLNNSTFIESNTDSKIIVNSSNTFQMSGSGGSLVEQTDGLVSWRGNYIDVNTIANISGGRLDLNVISIGDLNNDINITNTGIVRRVSYDTLTA